MVISAFLSRAVILVAGTLYPAYRSYKAVRTKDVKEYVKWMMYWIVFGLFYTGEAVADILLAFWFPFYYEIKIVFVIWLLSPWTKGSSILYRKWVHPMFMKHEDDIDSFLEQAKNESYKQVVNLGTRGLACARDIVATAALRGAQIGQVQLADLHRSYSTGDVSLVGRMAPADVRKRTVTQTTEKHIEEEEEEQLETRTWAGVYDEQGRIVEEYQIKEETIKKFSDEDVVVIEDPKDTKRHRRSCSRSRNSAEPGLADPMSIDNPDFGYNTLPRRSTRRTAAAAAAGQQNTSQS